MHLGQRDRRIRVTHPLDCVDREVLGLNGVAAPRAEGDTGTVTYVAVGRAVPSHRMRIVEPGTNRPLPARATLGGS